MQSKLQARTDSNSKIKSNPIELLNAIHEHSLSDEELQYEMSAIIDPMLNLVKLKQLEDEALIDFVSSQQ
jgi:hypothetical protein